jgi:hypothetical protein
VKFKFFALAAAFVLLVAGCSGGKYAEEKTVMSAATKAMETLNSSMTSAGTPEEVAKVVNTFTGSLEKVLPKLKELTTNHPEWENEPPKELEGAFDDFKKASQEFQSTTLPKLMQTVQENVGNMDLQNAMQKLNSVASQL